MIRPVLAQVTLPDSSSIGLDPNLNTLGDIISRAFEYLLIIAGLSMFGMILWGGVHLIISRGNPEGIKEGTNKIIYGIIGFLVVFATYWIIQIIETIFHLSIL